MCVSSVSRFAQFVERIVARGSPPTGGELAEIAVLRKAADEEIARKRSEGYGAWGGDLVVSFREYSSVVGVMGDM
jgi:hypothetical protein